MSGEYRPRYPIVRLICRFPETENTLLYGWCLPEAGGRWTDGPEAVVAVDVGDYRGDLRVTVTLFPMLAVPKSRVEVWANRRWLDDWRFAPADAGMHQRMLEIPASALHSRFLVLTFVIYDPRSPRSLGVSSNPRLLGVFVGRLTFEMTATTGYVPRTIQRENPVRNNQQAF